MNLSAKSLNELLEAAESDGLLSPELRLRDVLRSAGRPPQPLNAAALRDVRTAWSAANLLGVSQLATAEMLERLGDAPKNAELAEALAAGLPQDVLEEALRQPGGILKTAASLRAAAVSTPSPRPGVFEAGHIDSGLAASLTAALEEGAEIHLMRGAIPEAGTRCRVLDVAQAIGPGGLEADYLVASVDAASRSLGDGMLVVAGLARPCCRWGSIMAPRRALRRGRPWRPS